MSQERCPEQYAVFQKQRVKMLKVENKGMKIDSVSLSESQFIVNVCKARSDIYYLNIYIPNGNYVNSYQLGWAANLI